MSDDWQATVRNGSILLHSMHHVFFFVYAGTQIHTHTHTHTTRRAVLPRTARDDTERPKRRSMTSVYSSITVVAGPQSSSPPAHSTNEEPSNMLCTTTFAICLMPACMHARTQAKVSGAPCPQQARCTQARGRARHAGAATELLARPWALQEEEHHGRERQRRGCKHHGRQACRQRPARNADVIMCEGRGLARAARVARAAVRADHL